MPVSINNCDTETAKKIALARYEDQNHAGNKFRVHEMKQDSIHFFIKIYAYIDDEDVIDDGMITEIAGGGAMYTIDKNTCKIIAVEGYE